MDPGLILILGFLLAIAVFYRSRVVKKKHRINPEPAPDTPEPETEESAPRRPRASYGAARARTRNRLK